MHGGLHRDRGWKALVREATGAACLAGIGTWSVCPAAPAAPLAATPLSGDSQADAGGTLRRRIEIPAMAALEALRALGGQTGAQILAPSTILQDVRTQAVSGDFTPAEAVRLMLAGTGLQVIDAAPGVISIRRPQVASPERPSAAPTESIAAADGQLTEVTVTGSRLPRSTAETAEPAIVTPGDTVRSRVVSNIGEVLEETPGFGVSAANIGANQTPFGVGQTFVDFLGLGSQRTLTLVNGRRYVTSNAATGFTLIEPGQQVDLGLIPVDLIDRLETIAIGGAPVYGSDAIAGTLNIILKDHFEGLQMRSQYGISSRGDAQSELLAGLAGTNFAADRGNLVLSVQYMNQGGLQESDRSYLQYGRGVSEPDPGYTGAAGGAAAQIFLPDRVTASLTDGGIPIPPTALGDMPPGTRGALLPRYPNGLYVFDAAGHPLQFGSDGSLVPLAVGRGALSPLLAQRGLLDAPLFLSGGDGLRGEHLSLLARTDRLLLSSLGHFDFAPGLQGFFELSYGRTMGEEREIVAPYGVAFSAGANIPMTVDNAFLTANDRRVLLDNGLSTFGLSKNLSDITDTHPGNSVQQLYRAVAGLRGTVEVTGQSLKWDASLNFGRTRTRSELFYIDPERLRAAAQAVRDPAGKIVCAGGAPGCVPIDLFGLARESAAAIDYVSGIGRALNTNTQRIATLNLGTDFYLGRAAPLEINIGYEHRQEDADFDPDALMRAGNVFLPPIVPVTGSFKTNEVYGEALVPVIRGVSVEGAVRYVDNSVAGADSTWSLGTHLEPRLGRWSEGLSIRGVLAHSVRAPAATELFLPPSTGRTTAQDPCDSRYFSSGPDPAIRARNCAAALSQFGVTPGQFVSLIVDNPHDGIDGAGNLHLHNETAESWSAGFVDRLSPHLTFAADWIHIRLRSGIENLTLTQILDACYDSPAYPEPPACSAFTRGSGLQAGQIAQYRSGFINSSALEFSGFLGRADYTLDLGGLVHGWQKAGPLTLGMQVAHIARFRQDVLAGVSEELRGQVGYPAYKISWDIKYRLGSLDALLRTVWTSAVKLDNGMSTETLPINNVGSYCISNLTVGLNVTARVRVQLLIDNLFDREPPAATILQPTDISRRAYDRVGRTLALSVSGAF